MGVIYRTCELCNEIIIYNKDKSHTQDFFNL